MSKQKSNKTTDKLKNLDLNQEFKHALDLMENSDKNIFVTGRAGTGKSTLLEYFRHHTKKKIVVLAPTGVAAVNVHGQTIHSFFRFKPDIALSKIKKKGDDNDSIYKKLDAIVIDEVSMVRADLLDCVDKFMRLNGRDNRRPFGGTQMIFIGDLYQLPPVVTSRDRTAFANSYGSPYFFSAMVFTDRGLLHEGFKMEMIELEKIYRQKDQGFIDLLNMVRNNSVTDSELEMLNIRHDANFFPRESELYVYLTSTNAMAQEMNEIRLNDLAGQELKFTGEILGKFDNYSLPTEEKLVVKVGAQVMMLNNDQLGRWINGSTGKIVNAKKDERGGTVIVVKLDDGEEVEVVPYTWDLYEYRFDRSTKSIESKSVGSFTQYPLRLAWAITIHKSQGKTFNKVVVDIGRGTFAHGQMYVALSRCTSLEGLVLKKPIEKRHIWMDCRVVQFVTKYQNVLSENNCPLDKKVE